MMPRRLDIVEIFKPHLDIGTSLMKSPEQYARARIAQADQEIRRSLRMVATGNPLGSEPDPARRRGRLQAKANLTTAEARILDAEICRRSKAMLGNGEAAASALEAIPPAVPRRLPGGAEAIWGDTVDFVDVAFLSKGARTARSVGRVARESNGRAQGSGVLIGIDLFLTNNHVIENAALAGQFILEFDYERDEMGKHRAETRFFLDPSVFVGDDPSGLDFTIIGVGRRRSGPAELEDFGTSPLSDASDKHMLGEFANIVQHPQGRLKEVVLRENRLVSRFDDFLHYVADTEKGSSGSPVYNSEWQMIALHHWGSPWGAPGDPLVPGSLEVNEGIRVSSIVRHLRRNMGSYSAEMRPRLEAALASVGGEAHGAEGPIEPVRRSRAPSVEVDEQGRATWTVPIEISVRLPVAGERPEPRPGLAVPAPVAERSETADAYADRKGYMPHFLPHFELPLPRLGPSIEGDAARLLDLAPGENPFELKYHHFSVIMNRRRRLAFVTACMIDGATSKSIGRRSRRVGELSADDRGLAETVGSLDDAEADSWTADPRIDREHQWGNELYRNQIVPGFPDPSSAGRIARMFQKGHLVRRIDPAWGNAARALEAEIDTFHWTNAAPQVGFFNQGRADEDHPDTGRGKLWRAAENYVLRNAVAEDQRVVSFTGPIFDANDRPFRGTRVPGRFFKVTTWVEDGELRSLALIVDQTPVIEIWPESLGDPNGPELADAAEAFQDPGELDRVADFLSTVEEVEHLTDLDFGDAMRVADIRHGQDARRIEVAADLPLSGAPRRGGIDDAGGADSDPPEDPDLDLQTIKGIGPKLERQLNRMGIHRVSQIANWDAEEARNVSIRVGYAGRVERDRWVEQARAISDEDGDGTEA
jgi:endonuclease G, mitochondrial